MKKVIRLGITVMLSLILLNVLAFIGIGIYRCVTAYISIYNHGLDEHPGARLAEAFDSFLIALFFIVFSVGISRLFLPGKNFLNNYELPWLEIQNFSELKLILWELLLTTLLVFFVTKIPETEHLLRWELLIFPGVILLLAASYRLLKKH